MNVNVGGDRLRSGAKMNVELHNYNRSTHNLNKNFKSSLACGCLYPAYVNVGLNGDKFEMDIESIVRTLPTQGPLFGAFKMQVDVFVAPMRLYQGILHNNPINIGLQMQNVKLPKVRLFDKGNKDKISQVHPSNLWKYLGLSGLGIKGEQMTGESNMFRDINALPLLAYYDIFKNYYANKQEDDAFVIGENLIVNDTTISSIEYAGINYTSVDTIDVSQGNGYLVVNGNNVAENAYKINIKVTDQYGNDLTSYFPVNSAYSERVELFIQYTGQIKVTTLASEFQSGGIKLQKFPLENIDKMRESILKFTELGETFMINNFVDDSDDSLMLQPYQAACGFNSTKRVGFQSQPMCGLVVKTYQSDLFNNWIKTETIEGTNGIREITTIDTTNGLELDALNLAQKVYNMLNRIAVSGGTYEDWQEAVFTSSTIRKAETPMYMGGMSSEVMFEEVIATTAQETSNDKQALGSLGGRGKQIGKKGGHLEFNIEEPSIIMAIVSLTPRICYSQGNKWFLTELDSIDDLHKPALDGIGYQDLLVERMAWWDTKITNVVVDGEYNTRLVRNSAGKVPAWMDYMTDIDECYGDFALDAATSFMVLNRDYAQDDEFNVSDITTYIDPSKYNYAFAYNELFAQNFWAEIQFDVKARRLMSAKQIPNL